MTLKHHTLFFFSLLLSFFGYSADYYWVGGSGNWSDFSNHWATTSAGSVFHTSAPTSDDNVFFDENSFSEDGQAVTVNGQGSAVFCKNMDWTGARPAIFNFIGSDPSDGVIVFRGSIVLNPNLNVSVKTFSLTPTSAMTFDSKGIRLNETELFVNLLSGSVTILDSLSVNKFTTTNVRNSFDLNEQPMHVVDRISITTPISESGLFDFSNSNIYTKNLDFRVSIDSDATLKTSGSKLHIYYPDGFTSIDKTLSTIPLFEEYIILENHRIVVNDPNFDRLEIGSGVELTMDAGADEVEFNSLVANGSRAYRIVLKSLGQTTFIQNDGFVDVAFADLENIATSGGAIFTAFASTASGTTTGWNFQKIDQDISFDLDDDKTFEDIGDVLNLSASTSSDLDVQLVSSNESVAKISGLNELLIIGQGTAEISATQTGDEFYNAAASVIRLFSVTKASQAISFGEIPDTSVDDNFVNLQASSTSDLELTYEVVGPASVVGNTLEFTGTGPVQVTALQVGNENYFAAEAVSRSFVILESSNPGKPLAAKSENPRVMLYPNPVIDQLIVNPNRSLEQIMVFDNQGNLLLESKINATRRTILDVSRFEPGVYFVQLQDFQGLNQTERLIKVD